MHRQIPNTTLSKTTATTPRSRTSQSNVNTQHHESTTVKIIISAETNHQTKQLSTPPRIPLATSIDGLHQYDPPDEDNSSHRSNEKDNPDKSISITTRRINEHEEEHNLKHHPTNDPTLTTAVITDTSELKDYLSIAKKHIENIQKTYKTNTKKMKKVKKDEENIFFNSKSHFIIKTDKSRLYAIANEPFAKGGFGQVHEAIPLHYNKHKENYSTEEPDRFLERYEQCELRIVTKEVAHEYKFVSNECLLFQSNEQWHLCYEAREFNKNSPSPHSMQKKRIILSENNMNKALKKSLKEIDFMRTQSPEYLKKLKELRSKNLFSSEQLEELNKIKKLEKCIVKSTPRLIKIKKNSYVAKITREEKKGEHIDLINILAKEANIMATIGISTEAPVILMNGTKGQGLLITEHLGTSIKTIAANKPNNEDMQAKLDIALQAAIDLFNLHKKHRMTHGDINDKNILTQSIIDYGATITDIDDPTSLHKRNIYTELYQTKEQIEKKGTSQLTDISNFAPVLAILLGEHNPTLDKREQLKLKERPLYEVPYNFDNVCNNAILIKVRQIVLTFLNHMSQQQDHTKRPNSEEVLSFITNLRNYYLAHLKLDKLITASTDIERKNSVSFNPSLSGKQHEQPEISQLKQAIRLFHLKMSLIAEGLWEMPISTQNLTHYKSQLSESPYAKLSRKELYKKYKKVLSTSSQIPKSQVGTFFIKHQCSLPLKEDKDSGLTTFIKLKDIPFEELDEKIITRPSDDGSSNIAETITTQNIIIEQLLRLEITTQLTKENVRHIFQPEKMTGHARPSCLYRYS